MPRLPKAKPSSSKADSTATIGFDSRVCGIWLSADSRGEAETAEGNRSNAFSSAA